MSVQLITATSFPQLENRLLTDLRAAGALHPLSPTWIVVPSATLANHLRVRLARHAADTAFAGVHVINLPRFAQRLCAALLGRTAPRWSPSLDLLLLEVVAELPEKSALGSLKTLSGCGTLLRETFSDFAEAGFSAAELETIEALAAEPDLAPAEQETLRIYARWLGLIQARGIEWSPLTLAALPERIEQAGEEQIRAALGCEDGTETRLCLHGFYEWTDVNLQWIAALAQRVTTTIYYPYQKDHPAFAFASPVLDDLRVRLGDLQEQACAAASGEVEKFFRETFPEGDIGPRPDFLTHQAASGTRAEVVSAAVRIRRWLDDAAAPLAPEEILVVAPQAEEYAEVVQDVFRAFAIPVRISDVAAGPVPEQEPLRMLARIWEEQAPAEWVLALLRACPEIPVAQGIDVDRFEWKVRELGIWGGAAWRTAWERKEFKTKDEENRRRQIQFDDAEKKLIGELLVFVPAEGRRASARLSPGDALPVLRLLAERWLVDATALRPLIEVAQNAARHAPALEVELRQWALLLAEGAASRTQRDPLSCAVLFTPLMRARGLTAKAVVVLGLAAGQLPQRIQDDPVLSENASARIARAAQGIGHRLAVKTRVTEEMLMLFFLINTAAERVHWVVPETDASGKAVAPTPWVQRYLQRWVRKDQPPEDPFTRRVARSPSVQAQYLADLDRKAGSYLPPALALFVDPSLASHGGLSVAEAFLMESAARRGHDLAWSGGISAMPSFRDNAVSVTGLEALARCPFRFYAEKVAGWEPLDALSLSHHLDPMTRGTLLHWLLEQAVKPHLKKKSVGEIAGELLRGEARALWKLAEQLPVLKPEAAFALAMLPAVFQQAALRDVVRMAIGYFQWARENHAVPQQVEEVFRQPFPGLENLEVIGKIDRIDQLDGATEVTDFKSAKSPGSDYRRLVKLGWQVQASLYPWLCGQTAATFRYLFLGQFEAEVGDAAGAPEATQFLGELAPILRQGTFLPTSNEVLEELGIERVSPCRYCQSVSACRRFESQSAQRHAALFQQVAPQRISSIQAAVAKKAAAKIEAGPAAGAKPKRGKKSK